MIDRVNVRIRMEDGGLWATVDEYPGVFAVGESPEELRASVEEGIALYVAEPGHDVRVAHLAPFASAAALVSTELVFS